MSALITARMTGKRVKITGATTETEESWALPNGQIEAEIHSGPVRILDGQGGWMPVDFNLARQPDGSVVAKAHPYGLRLSGAAGEGEHDLITLGTGEQASSMVWSGRLPEPVIEGAKATYPEVRPGVDLLVEATRTGYEQFLIVKSPSAIPHVRRLALPLRSKGVSYKADGRGGLEVRSRAGKLIGSSPAPVMWDAQVSEISGNRLRLAVIPTKVVARSAERTDVTLLPDEAWLTDPATVWPVTIDPSENWGPSFDTFVQTGFTDDQSAVGELKVGYSDDGGTWTARSFLSWPTASLVGKQVTAASLYLWNYHSWSCVTANWQVWTTGPASTATRWTNQPSWLHHEGTSNQTKGYNSSCNDGWVSAPATSFFQRAVSAGVSTAHMGIRAAEADETNHLTWKRFHSKEGANDPYVRVTYQAPPTVTGRATIPEVSCVTGSGRPFINTTTPKLRAQGTDGEASPVSVRFEWAAVGGAVIGSATTGPSPSGSWLETTVPAGAFSNGGSYSWRAQAYDGAAWGAWSPYCEFTVDTLAPGAAPTVASTTYPERPPTPTGYISSTENRPFLQGSIAVALTGDDARTSVTLPFPFTFYGQQYTTAWIDTNGQLSFLDAGTFYNVCEPLPTTTAPNAVIYAFCDDLNVDASAGVYTAMLGTAPNRQFVVEWRNVIRNASKNKPVELHERVDVSVILSEDGEIAVNYGGIGPDPEEEGGNALIGVENATGTLAEQYSYRTRVLADGKAVVFRPGVLPFTSYAKTTATQTYTSATTALALTGNNEIEQVTLPFPFAYYGRVYSSVWVDINGQVYFTDPQGSHDDVHCVPIPNTALPNGGISPYCDDLRIDAQSQVRVGTTGVAPNRAFTVEWWNARHDDDATQRVNVTAALGENGTITFNYSGLDNAAEQGLTALVGIEHKAGTSGIQHSYHESVLTNNGAIVFTPQYGQATSTGGAGIAGSFTFGPSGIADVASYQYGLNTNPPDTSVNAASLGGIGTASITPTADGPQILYVRSQDRAGNKSPIRQYHFFAGPGGLTSPKPGDITAAKFALTAEGHPASTAVTYQWRRGDVDTWITVPASYVTYATGGTPVSGWPIPTSGSGKYPKLNWDVAATLAAVDPQLIARDGPLQVRAIFSGLSNGEAKAVKVTFDRNEASGASEEVGPGSVSLITGDFSMSDTDVSIEAPDSNLSVTRSYRSRDAAGMDSAHMFGPGWVSGTVVDDISTPYTSLNVYGSLVQVGTPDGDTVGFTKRTSVDFDPEVGMESFKLTHDSITDVYTLESGNGNTVTFTRIAGSAAGRYFPTAATVAGDNDSSVLSWEKVTINNEEVVRPTRMVAPNAGVNCTTLIRGCRALTFTYAMTATATGTTESAWGDYIGRVKEISYTAWDPDLPTPALRTVIMARYAYDSGGRLRATWDPRLDWNDQGTSRHLRVTYDYNLDGLLSSIKPHGEEPWQLSYTTIPGDSGRRLHQMSRSALAAGTATTTIVYKVPVTGTGAPYDLSPAQTNRWSQPEAPTDATAVFPATQVPDGNPSTGTLPSSYERATVTYMDANARTVNSATPGGSINATWYDQWGNVIRTLTAGNRAKALAASSTDDAAAETMLARSYSTLSIYSSDGQQLFATLDPERDVMLTSGVRVRGRGVTRNIYDQGAPSTGGPYNLITTQEAAVRSRDPQGVEGDADKRTTTTTYDWALRQPIAVTVDPGGLAATTRTTYDAATGLATSTTNPAGGTNTTTPATRRMTYYRVGTGSGRAECDSRPEWANLVCRVETGGQAAFGPELPAITITYDMFGQPRVVTETTSAGVRRTTTTSYDGAGRPYELSVTGTTGTSVPRQRNIYDPASGQLVRVQSVVEGTVTAEIVKRYDTLGRLISYTDADGVASTTSYDLMGRVATSDNGKAQRSYAYDEGTERRGLLTSIQDSQAGIFSGSYDADGDHVSETWPNGVVVTSENDATGDQIRLTYAQPGCGLADCTLFSESVLSSAHGQWLTRTSSLSEQRYSYDQAGRLTMVNDTVGGRCATRTYGFSTATNRTSAVEYAPNVDGGCQTTTATSSRTWTYDTADRVNTIGYGYDALGRTTAVPATDSANPAAGSASITYHVSDMVDTITQGDLTVDYDLDVRGERVRSWTDNSSGTAVRSVHHYDGDSDNPSWTQEDADYYIRTVTGLSGMAGTYSSASTTVEWNLSNLHGDIVATVRDGEAGLSRTSETTEFGVARVAGDTERYGWLGSNQRAADPASGLILMGVRLYNPVTGRFLQVDPIYGGNANAYDYCSGDPINHFDLDGRYGYSFTYRIGWNPSLSSKTLMRIVKNAFWLYFPIPSNCATLSVGRRCSLAGSPVRVEAMWSTGFRFLSLPGHKEGAGKRITFSFSRRYGFHYLHVHAWGPNVTWCDKRAWCRNANRFAVYHLWSHFAWRIHRFGPLR